MSLSQRSRALLLCCLLSAGCANREPPEPILVGQVAPFSGPDKYIGDHVTQGLTLAVEDAHKDENRLRGRKVAVLTPDSRPVEGGIENKAVRLVAVDHVAALLGGTEPAQI